MNDEANKTDDDGLPPPANALEARERARANRKAAIAAQRDEQRMIDLDAIDEIEIALGDSNVTVIDLPYTPGLPTCVACRTPADPELKRYRHRVASGASKNEEGKASDPLAGVKAVEELADVVRVYPPDAEYAAIRRARPGVHAQLGTAAIALAVGRKEQEGKA
jgi:hypothetical protein